MDVRPGDRIKLLSMPSDPDPIPAGTTGTVLEVTSGLMAQIRVQWQITPQRSLALIPDVDEYEVIGHNDLVAASMGCPKCGNIAMDLLTWDEPCERVTCSLCGTTYEP